MTDETELKAAEQEVDRLRNSLRLLNTDRADPDTAMRPVCENAQALIIKATGKAKRWGRVRLLALIDLGEFLNRTPRLRGRAKKESSGDSLPSLADFGITDRHVAADAVNAANVSQQLRDDYLQITDQPTLKGLLRYAKVERMKQNLDPVQRHIETEIKEGGKKKRAAQSAAKSNAVSAGSRRGTSMRSALDMLFHERTSPEECKAAAGAVLRLDPHFIQHLAAALAPENAPAGIGGTFYEFRQQLAERDDLIAGYRSMLNQLKHGKGDGVLRKENAALRKEIAALREKNASLEQQCVELYNENYRLRRQFDEQVRNRESALAP